MPPPPIPVRTERSNPPPIPDSNEAIEPSLDERDNPSSTAAQAAERDPPQIPDGRRRPAGAVATSMVSGQGGLSSTVFRRQQEEATSEVVDEHSHANNPYDLLAAPGSTVTASYPFHGDEELQQLSFVVGDVIKVKEKQEMWSWGILERDGKEGWFPHNYVGGTFKPLPGIHELAAKLQKRREQQEQQEEDSRATTVTTAADHTHDGGATKDTEGAAGNVTTGVTGVSGVDVDPSGTAGEDVANVAGVGSSPNPSNGSVVGGAHGSASTAEGGQGAASASLRTDKDFEGIQGTQVTGAGVVAEGEGKSSNVLVTANAADSRKSRTSQAYASAAPSLPPFSKSSALSSGVAAKEALAQVPADEAKAAEAVGGSKIDGVGFAGGPLPVDTGCKCTIM